MNIKSKVYNNKILQMGVLQSSRVLEVHTTLTLLWNSQFEIMRRKVNEAVVELSSVEINHY